MDGNEIAQLVAERADAMLAARQGKRRAADLCLGDVRGVCHGSRGGRITTAGDVRTTKFPRQSRVRMRDEKGVRDQLTLIQSLERRR